MPSHFVNLDRRRLLKNITGMALIAVLPSATPSLSKLYSTQLNATPLNNALLKSTNKLALSSCSVNCSGVCPLQPALALKNGS